MTDRLRLKNPPLVEIWVEFRFSPADPESDWEVSAAEEFVGTFDGRFKVVECGISYGVQIQTIVREAGRDFRPVDPHVSFDALRAVADDSRESMIIGKDKLVSSLVPKSDLQPGYTALKARASEVLDRYLAHFKPTHIVQASLHYRDLVKLPTVDRLLNPDDYLTIWIKTPDWVEQPVGRMLLDVSFMPHNDNLLRLRIQSLPSTDTFAHFHMDWHLTCQRIESTDRDAIWGRLDQAHDRLLDDFWRSFTPRGQQLLQRI